LLRYQKQSTRELLETAANSKEVRHLCFLNPCLQELRQGERFASAWETGLIQAQKQMDWNEEDVRIARMVGQILGASDTETQNQELDLVMELSRRQLEQAKGEEAQLGKMYRTLGVLSGIGIAVFLW
jgi:stage III sporulation protein AB